jgi:hypothetical protein
MVWCALARDHRPWNFTRSAGVKNLKRLLAGFTAGKDFHLALKIN